MITGTCHCGALHWTFGETPTTATACNCSLCRRYGALWIYGWTDTVRVSGQTAVYSHGDHEIGFHHCPICGCVGWWIGLQPHRDGRTRLAVNLRLADDPEAVAALPIRHFEGFETFTALPADGRTVRDIWF